MAWVVVITTAEPSMPVLYAPTIAPTAGVWFVASRFVAVPVMVIVAGTFGPSGVEPPSSPQPTKDTHNRVARIVRMNPLYTRLASRCSDPDTSKSIDLRDVGRATSSCAGVASDFGAYPDRM